MKERETDDAFLRRMREEPPEMEDIIHLCELAERQVDVREAQRKLIERVQKAERDLVAARESEYEARLQLADASTGHAEAHEESDKLRALLRRLEFSDLGRGLNGRGYCAVCGGQNPKHLDGCSYVELIKMNRKES